MPSRPNIVARTPLLNGDIVLGSGNDSVSISAGIVTGDMHFGAGSDSLTIDAGTVINNQGEEIDEVVIVSGAIYDTDGDLAIQVADGALQITNTGEIGFVFPERWRRRRARYSD